MVTLLCPVRACGAPLERRERSWACPRGHSFDIARAGYCNLLQPQDRKSKNPGDPKEAALARRRFLEAGHGDFLLRALQEEIQGTTVLDVGCGEGFFLGSLSKGREAHGVDLSVPAIDLAARRWPEVNWWVVNADRSLPFADGSFDTALSIAGRRPAAELRRVVKGRLLVAVPGEDDLIELREAVLGEGRLLGRVEKTVAELAGFFELESHRTVRSVETVNAQDALAATYRGARQSQQKMLGEMEVTLSFDLLRFK